MLKAAGIIGAFNVGGFALTAWIKSEVGRLNVIMTLLCFLKTKQNKTKQKVITDLLVWFDVLEVIELLFLIH